MKLYLKYNYTNFFFIKFIIVLANIIQDLNLKKKLNHAQQNSNNLIRLVNSGPKSIKLAIVMVKKSNDIQIPIKGKTHLNKESITSIFKGMNLTQIIGSIFEQLGPDTWFSIFNYLAFKGPFQPFHTPFY